MAKAIDVLVIDHRVRSQVSQRGLFLIAPDPLPDRPNTSYVVVCTDPDPANWGVWRVGMMYRDDGDSFVAVYAMCGRNPVGLAKLDRVRAPFTTWEDGIMTILAAYDQFR